MAFRGIGQKLAARILLFREKLGGFYSVDQVRETYGLPDSIFIRIRPMLKIGETGEGALRKIDLNSSGIEELRQHPYIRWNLTRRLWNSEISMDLLQRPMTLKSSISLVRLRSRRLCHT
jgi:hypothetical protein